MVVMRQLATTYCGSNDLEVFDALDFSDYVQQKYGSDAGNTMLNDIVLHAEGVVMRHYDGWLPPAPQDIVLDPPEHEGEHVQ